MTGRCSGALCASTIYREPAVPFGILPNNAALLGPFLDATRPPYARTYRAALAELLRGAINYSRNYAAANMGVDLNVVVASAFAPSPDCLPSDPAGVAAIATEGASNDKPIKTYAFGAVYEVYSELSQSPAGVLNAIAAAGGTREATLVTSADAGPPFRALLESIRDAAPRCEYLAPADASRDGSNVEVRATARSGVQTRFPHRDRAGSCESSGGWYFGPGDPGAPPTRIILCPSTCDALEGVDIEATLEIVVGCSDPSNAN